jgi:predicted RNA-binding protein with TRAM domain
MGVPVAGSPVSIGDIIEVRIEDILEDGEGSATLPGRRTYKIFVKGSNIKAGDTVRVLIQRLMPDFASGMKI